jgi:hypothetical protein
LKQRELLLSPRDFGGSSDIGEPWVSLDPE